MIESTFPTEPGRAQRRSAPLWICGCVASALLTHEVQGQDYDPNWSRHFRVGALVGFNIKTELSLTGNVRLPGGKEGVFDDGYVIVDPNVTTGDFTSNWDYQNASQYNGTDRLTLHRVDSFTPDSNLGSSKGDDGPFVGVDVAYGGNLWYWCRTRIGWEVGFGFLPISATDGRSFTAQANRSISEFDTTGSSPYDIFFPPPGNAGTGGVNSRSIHSTPTGTSADTVSDIDITGSRTLDVSLYMFRLGPSFFWDINPYIGLSASAGPAVGLITGSYRFNETIDDTPRKGQFGVSDVTIGGYVNGTFTYHAVKNGDFYLSVQYMPLGTSTFNHGGRQAQLDLQGAVYLSAGINWPF